MFAARSAILLLVSSLTLACANQEVKGACENAFEVADTCGILSPAGACSPGFFKARFTDDEAAEVACMYDCFSAASCGEIAEYHCTPYAAYRNTAIWECWDECRVIAESNFVVSVDVDCASDAAAPEAWPLGVTEQRVSTYCDEMCALDNALFAECNAAFDKEQCKTECEESSSPPLCLAQREAILACQQEQEEAVCSDGKPFFNTQNVSAMCSAEADALQTCLCEDLNYQYCDPEDG